MHTDWRNISSFLQAEDIEGLIEIGAPLDEYNTEAQEFSRTISGFPSVEINEANLAATLALTWAKSFNLSEDDLAKRMPAIHRVALHVLAG